MPYPFVLPTTSAFAFSFSFSSETHPSLPLNASTHRGIVRDRLKKHKRLPPSGQSSSLSSVVAALGSYLSYLFTVDVGLGHKVIHDEYINVILKTAPAIQWRPTLSSRSIPGKDPARVKITSLEHELFFSLSTLANAHTLLARKALQPLYATSSAPVGTQQRQTAIATATKHLLEAASIFGHLASRDTEGSQPPPCVDIAPGTVRAQAALALADATLLAVLKDDPYPAVVAQGRNAQDKEWMYKAPDIPKVRVHLFARLCLAASEHTAEAQALCSSAGSDAKLDSAFVRYLDDLRRTSRAKACRFFGIGAELVGQTGQAIAWLHAGLQELGVEWKGEAVGSQKPGLSLLSLKREWTEKREDRKVEKGLSWGADAGRLEETRVIEMLEGKWTKQNNMYNIQAVPSTSELLGQMPSGREIHTVSKYQPPLLDAATLEAMRAPPDRSDDAGSDTDSEDDILANQRDQAVGSFPGTHGAYRTAMPSY